MVTRRKTKAEWPQITGSPPATPCRLAVSRPSPRILRVLPPAQAAADTQSPAVRSAEAARLWAEARWAAPPVAVTARAEAAATTRAATTRTSDAPSLVTRGVTRAPPIAEFALSFVVVISLIFAVLRPWFASIHPT